MRKAQAEITNEEDLTAEDISSIKETLDIPEPVTIGTNGQIPFVNVGGDDFEYSNNLTFIDGKLQVNGFVSSVGATATATSIDTIANDINGFNLTARSGQTDRLYGQRIKGTLTFNTVNQVGYGLLIDLTTNATTSQIFNPLVVQTSVDAESGSILGNTSMSANSGSSLMVVRGASGSTGQQIILNAKSTSAFFSKGVIFQDYETTNYWALGTVDSDYLRFFHNSASAAAGAVNPTMFIQDNRVFVGRYAASAIGATLDVRGEGNTTALSLRVRNLSGGNTFQVRDDGRINAPLLPTSSAGLIAGDLWNDAGTLKIV
jgi:hypothetical protein